jgi:hypothetical protein
MVTTFGWITQTLRETVPINVTPPLSHHRFFESEQFSTPLEQSMRLLIRLGFDALVFIVVRPRFVGRPWIVLESRPNALRRVGRGCSWLTVLTTE